MIYIYYIYMYDIYIYIYGVENSKTRIDRLHIILNKLNILNIRNNTYNKLYIIIYPPNSGKESS
jgi:hypothetical protein